jgi:AcrR family transcriptional regulator
MADTKGKILDTAERLFAERGFGATSLRSIIGEAGVNLAAVHYHFHSKEALLDAVLRRRLEPVTRERLAMLDECEAAAGDGPPDLEAVLVALVAPPLRLRHQPAYATFIKLMGRILAESDVGTMRKHFGVTIERFTRALEGALPDLPRQELMWRAHFSVGCMAHTLLHGAAGIMGTPGEVTTESLVAFLAGGFRAAAPAGARSHA